MAQSSTRRIERSLTASAGFQSRPTDKASTRGTHQGQRSCATAPKGRTHDCKRPVLLTKITLAGSIFIWIGGSAITLYFIQRHRGLPAARNAIGRRRRGQLCGQSSDARRGELSRPCRRAAANGGAGRLPIPPQDLSARVTRAGSCLIRRKQTSLRHQGTSQKCHYRKWEAIPLHTHGHLLYRLE